MKGIISFEDLLLFNNLDISDVLIGFMTQDFSWLSRRLVSEGVSVYTYIIDLANNQRSQTRKRQVIIHNQVSHLHMSYDTVRFARSNRRAKEVVSTKGSS